MSEHYILDENNKVVEADLMTWARWFEGHDRKIARTQVGKNSVSTVFLGLDHSFGGGPPLLFETMIFPTADNDDYQTRAETREQALEQHITAIESLLSK